MPSCAEPCRVESRYQSRRQPAAGHTHNTEERSWRHSLQTRRDANPLTWIGRTRTCELPHLKVNETTYLLFHLAAHQEHLTLQVLDGSCTPHRGRTGEWMMLRDDDYHRLQPRDSTTRRRSRVWLVSKRPAKPSQVLSKRTMWRINFETTQTDQRNRLPTPMSHDGAGPEVYAAGEVHAGDGYIHPPRRCPMRFLRSGRDARMDKGRDTYDVVRKVLHRQLPART